MNRRQFIKNSGAAATFLAAAPFVLASDKSGSKLPVVGEGKYQYEVIHDWGELPAGHVYGNTHGAAVDAQGHVHIKHTVGKDATIETPSWFLTRTENLSAHGANNTRVARTACI
jgi:hypothetical protein